MNAIERIAIIFNVSKKRKNLQQYVEMLQAQKPNLTIDIFSTESLDDGRKQAAKAAESGYSLIVSAGGDGTLLGVVNGAMGTDTPVTPLPFGSGNDTAKALGIFSLDDAVKALMHGNVRRVDAGRCSYRDEAGTPQQIFFCSTAGLGLFADMFLLERRLSMPLVKKIVGDLIWPMLTLICLIRSRNIETSLVFDSQTYRTRLRLLEVSKVKKAGGWLFTPHAMLDNSILDAWMVHRVNRRQFAAMTPKVLRNTIALDPPTGYEYFTAQPASNSFGVHHATRIEVMPEQPLPLHVHGEPLGHSPATFEVFPNALHMLACLPGEETT